MTTFLDIRLQLIVLREMRERSYGVITMNTITRCPAGAAAVATQVRGGKRAANIVTTMWGDTQWRRELGETRDWRGYTGTLNRVLGPVRTCQPNPRYI